MAEIRLVIHLRREIAQRTPGIGASPPPKKNPDMGRVGEELIFGILKSALILGGVRVSNDGGVRCGIGVCQGHIPTILMKFSSPSLHNLARVLLQAEILYIVSITI